MSRTCSYPAVTRGTQHHLQGHTALTFPGSALTGPTCEIVNSRSLIAQSDTNLKPPVRVWLSPPSCLLLQQLGPLQARSCHLFSDHPSLLESSASPKAPLAQTCLCLFLEAVSLPCSQGPAPSLFLSPGPVPSCGPTPRAQARSAGTVHHGGDTMVASGGL